MSKRVLLIDDEDEIVTFLSHFLKRFKILTIKTTSGREALEVYDKKKIDLTFLDIQMKDMNGLEVLKKIKAINSEAKVIMITAKSDLINQSKAREFGALDYVIKPLDLSELKEKIERYILQE